ncbi:MotA/TolQ/ExbB proton channel family protein [Erythrobacter sp. THAF29]|uniref:MotA/TolQ/ExbB proton channel family protein n=1 Tax=Erythrobacter sp. THAF29 TaxID=2587851 RepID=UPI001268365B|nr:MotA/TolQ/ExbB proton channel family protein [Erythrobacter sp. THAF29]QFT76189.1 Biopolymer transport protein ExbB [Erythrobacter sp. THAF29]
MNVSYLLATATDAPVNEFGFWKAMEEGGPVAWSILAVMVIMSVGSFYILFTKLFEQNKVMKQYKSVKNAFWRAPTLREGATKLEKNSAWRQLADDAVTAQDHHSKMDGAGDEIHFIEEELENSQEKINSVLSGGLSFLASVGATAPFIGLLGTVIGIYRALINIGIEGSASIDKVAGPVGEALIMTAIGLLVAVPAVLAFNWLQSRNRRIAALMKEFANDIVAYIGSNGEIKPALGPASAAKGAPKAAAKPATTAGGARPTPKA